MKSIFAVAFVFQSMYINQKKRHLTLIFNIVLCMESSERFLQCFTQVTNKV